MEVLGRKLKVDNLAVGITLDSIVTSGRREARTATVVREIGPPGVNAARLGALESLAAKSEPGVAPQEIAGQLAAIEKGPRSTASAGLPPPSVRRAAVSRS